MTTWGLSPLSIRGLPPLPVRAKWMANSSKSISSSDIWFELHKKSQPQNESPNAPNVRNIVGTTVLAIVCGFTRYVHINRLRNDTVPATLLGLGRTV